MYRACLLFGLINLISAASLKDEELKASPSIHFRELGLHDGFTGTIFILNTEALCTKACL